ncbi:MAG: B12-binding domain-containing protein [bacterium]
MHRLLAKASQRDRAACDALLAEARALGVQEDSLLVGLLQPVLYQAGREWQAGRMSVAAEHWLTSWCEEAFASVPTVDPKPPLDLIIFQAPGNIHTLGPRFAAKILAARGLSVESFVPALPLGEMVGLIVDGGPRTVGFSCSLPDSVSVACDLIEKLQARPEPVFKCRYIVSGHAFRMGGGQAQPAVCAGADIVMDVMVLADEMIAGGGRS